MSGRLNLFSVRPGAPFLPTLADALLTNRLLPRTDLAADDLTIARTTIYVPTRRAARNLRGAIVERLGKKAAILPRVLPLGEFDEEAAFFETDGEKALELPAPVEAIERILTLAPLVLAWKKRLPDHVAAMFGEKENLVVPASFADAIWLARDIAALIDSVETEEADFARFAAVVPQELAGWWQVTLEFLRIVTEYWPAILAERGRMNPAAHRNALIEAETARIAAGPDGGPIIAAGSTGSIPATARLLSAIARHPHGAVVLPGLDLDLDAGSWAKIGMEAGPSAHVHPQFGLRKLLAAMGASREDVTPLGNPPDALAARCSLVAEALRPADTTDLWADHRDAIRSSLAAGALEGLSLVEAANEQEEALAIALALRRAAGKPGFSCALVTGDRNLARRVCGELSRFGIRADDSGGRSLSSAPAARLLRLIADAAFLPGRPEPLLDLFSHPLMLLGRRPSGARRSGAMAELVLLRGATGRPDVAGLTALASRRREDLLADRHAPPWLERTSAADWRELQNFLAEVERAFEPLCHLRGLREVELADCVRLLVQALELIGTDREGSLDRLYAGEEGEALIKLLRGLLASAVGLSCAPGEIPAVLDALLRPETVKPAAAGDSRISIWGVLEARLQDVDLVVLGGMNEGSWPRKVETGPFISRTIGTAIGLSAPERRIGQAAHDFLMAMGNREIMLSRALRADGAPTTPSRWLQRLLAIIPEDKAEAIAEQGRHLLELARALDRKPRLEPVRQPNPSPPLDARPRRFSVTEIETLRRDPYAVYARRVLRLERLDAIVREPGASDRGSLFHEILHRFSTEGINAAAPEACAELERIGRECFAAAGLPEDVHTLWWPRFAKMVPEWIRWESLQVRSRLSSFSEAGARATEIGVTGVTLSGRADRIDLYRDGAAILDFKTGSGPSKKQAHILLAPQLALEGALLMRGAFRDIGAAVPTELAYVRLHADGKVVPETILKHGNQLIPAVDLSERAWTQLERLIAFYAEEHNGYLSRALPMRENDLAGDYDHLARVQEWMAGHTSEEGWD